MALLLDTNVISDIARHPFGTVAGRVLERRGETLITRIIVVAEIRPGLPKGAQYASLIPSRVCLI